MEAEGLTEAQRSALGELAVNSNEKLEATGSMATTHALNLGCSMSFVPGAVIVIIVFLVSRGNWVAVGITAALTVMAAVVLASLLATVARKRAMLRDFELNIQPEIDRQVRDIPGGWDSFVQAARRELPEDAVLLTQLGLVPV